MKKIFSRHAGRRIRQRNLGLQRTKKTLGGGQLVYLGNKKYKSIGSGGEGKKITVIYKKDRGKNLVITAWRS